MRLENEARVVVNQRQMGSGKPLVSRLESSSRGRGQPPGRDPRRWAQEPGSPLKPRVGSGPAAAGRGLETQPHCFRLRLGRMEGGRRYDLSNRNHTEGLPLSESGRQTSPTSPPGRGPAGLAGALGGARGLGRPPAGRERGPQTVWPPCAGRGQILEGSNHHK